jgi:DNA-binding PadR family transcriptional regulator
MYRTLWRLEDAGWISRHVEATGGTVTCGKRTRTLPPRTYYLLTTEGTARAQAALDGLSALLDVARKRSG